MFLFRVGFFFYLTLLVVAKVSGLCVPALPTLLGPHSITSGREPRRCFSRLHIAASAGGEALDAADKTSITEQFNKGKKSWRQLRKEGGFLTFNTPIGALNPFAVYYGLISLLLGIPWFVSLKLCQLLYWVTRGKLDQKDFYSKNQPAMFVANHCSWMDIPFLGATVGWRNYKLISKKELGIIPILGTAIRVGGNIMVDRTNRKSQLKTLKEGINYLSKDGVHLCTFPEGTRSRTGRMLKFKNGAFKMAHKAGAPVVPISIVNSHKVMPTGWMFAMKPSRGTAKIVIHEPIESVGKTEEELADAVKKSMMNGLPPDQKSQATVKS